jgi:hypothetical protein
LSQAIVRSTIQRFGDALAVDDRSTRAGIPPRQLPTRRVECGVKAVERAIVVHRAKSSSKVLRGGRSFGIAAH